MGHGALREAQRVERKAPRRRKKTTKVCSIVCKQSNIPRHIVAKLIMGNPIHKVLIYSFYPSSNGRPQLLDDGNLSLINLLVTKPCRETSTMVLMAFVFSCCCFWPTPRIRKNPSQRRGEPLLTKPRVPFVVFGASGFPCSRKKV